jgi:hypothetical protein
MGMVGQVQFMHFCAQGDVGIPNETAALARGLSWANVQFAPPWATGEGNRTGSSGLGSRRLLDDAAGEGADCSEALTHEKKDCTTKAFQGNIGDNHCQTLTVTLPRRHGYRALTLP